MTDIVTGQEPPAALPASAEIVKAAIAADSEWVSTAIPDDLLTSSMITSVKHHIASAFAEVSVRKGTIYVRIIGRD